MTAIEAARATFAVTAAVHFLFVAVTLGVTPALAVAGTVRAVTRPDSDAFGTASRFLGWLGRPYLINYALGIVSGLVMELQLALNWGGLAKVASDVFGSALLLETVVAFMVESTAVGLWIFGWHLVPRWVHAALMWLITITAYASAYFIMVANGFLHRPTGAGWTGDRFELTDATAFLTNPSALAALMHVAGAALWVGGFTIAGGAAWLALRRLDFPVARAGLRAGVAMALIGSPVLVVSGITQFAVARPAGSAESGATGVLLAVMMFTWLLASAFTLFVLAPALIGTRLARWRAVLAVMAYAAPIPLLVTIFGWVYREHARQPWAIVGVLSTADGATAPAGPAALLTGGIAIAIVAGLAILNWVWLTRALHSVPRADLGLLPDPAPEPAAFSLAGR